MVFSRRRHLDRHDDAIEDEEVERRAQNGEGKGREGVDGEDVAEGNEHGALICDVPSW